MSKKNKSWSAEEKLAILKEHLVEGKSVADICEAKGLTPKLLPSQSRARLLLNQLKLLLGNL